MATSTDAQDALPATALDAPTLCAAFQRTAAQRPEAVALRTPGDALTITWREYAERVERVAGGLAALGVGRGDTVGLMLVNRPEFNLLDTAALHLGATPFSAYNSLPAEQLAFVLRNAGNRVLVTERRFADVVAAARRDAPAVEHVVLVDADDGDDDAMSLAALEELTPSAFSFDATWRAVEPADIATLIYTSGTTGPPKGVQLTHANLMAEVRGCLQRLPTSPGGRTVSYLPSAHIADRWSGHYQSSLCLGFTVTSIADLTQLPAVLAEVRPTAFGAVPRVWEKMKAALEAAGLNDPAAVPEEVRAGARARLGLDASEWFVAGAAPMTRDVLEYFDALGVPIAELYGMSELSCCATINPPDAIRLGTCGPPIDGVELRLLDDGELLVRGPTVMAGYRGAPEMTAETIDADGWLHTGDVARIDDDGYVTIVDRKKELIINAAGKNMSPANIESALKASSPIIGQAVAIGDRRPYNVALIVLDPDAAAAFAREQGIADTSVAALAREPAVRDAVARAVAAANTHLARVEQIKRCAILDREWVAGGPELTPTLKLQRRVVNARYGESIDELYAETPGEDVIQPS